MKRLHSKRKSFYTACSMHICKEPICYVGRWVFSLSLYSCASLNYNTIHRLSHCPFSFITTRQHLSTMKVAAAAIIHTNFLHHQIGNWLCLFFVRCFFLHFIYFNACVRTHQTAVLRFIVIVLYVKWHLKINLWFNCQCRSSNSSVLCVFFDCCCTIFGTRVKRKKQKKNTEREEQNEEKRQK